MRLSKTRLALGVLAALLALASLGLVMAKAVAPGVLPASWSAAEEADDRNVEIDAAARQIMTTFVKVDYNTVDEHISDVLADSTGTFKKQFEAQKVEFAALTRQERATATATIREVGITRSNENEALVSVAVDSTVLNRTTRQAIKKGEKVDNVRLYLFQVALTRVGERWLLSNLEVIG